MNDFIQLRHVELNLYSKIVVFLISMETLIDDEIQAFNSWLKKASVYCPYCGTLHGLPKNEEILQIEDLYSKTFNELAHYA